ncbi:hypothetical protein XELAEV_18009496mg [Xenopus laevis]|uniref:Uncharacterized protein n=1 Tax=Xenopus laevis TaxID=8355 RepID=A0A974DUW8_XENLA|nr:hypothetical protein XELAEV_18009496mg [Xenopus laevis]
MNEFWDTDARIQKANSVFNTDVDTSSDFSSVSRIFREFEHKLTKELHIWWEIASLEKYVTSQMIPRGLCIKKFPSYMHRDEVFMISWNKILSDCSFRLMELMIEHKTKVHRDVKIELKMIEKDIEQYKTQTRFDNIYESIKNNIKKLESDIMESKKKKYNRDSLDYMKDQVYNWASNRRDNKREYNSQRSILKNTSTPKKVSFSSVDRDSLDGSLAGSSPISSQSNRSEKAKDVFVGEQHFLKKSHTGAGQWTQKNANRELWKRQPEELSREQDDKNRYVLRKKNPKKY